MQLLVTLCHLQYIRREMIMCLPEASHSFELWPFCRYLCQKKKESCCASVVVVVVFVADTSLDFLSLFPGGERHGTNHRGPDHEKRHAASFYQVSTSASFCCHQCVLHSDWWYHSSGQTRHVKVHPSIDTCFFLNSSCHRAKAG